MLPTGLARSPRVEHPGGFSSRAAAGEHPGWVAAALCTRVPLLSPALCARAWLRLVFPGGVVLERGEAAQAQPRGVLRCGGREHCVEEDEDENTQLQPAGAQSGG